MAGGAPGVWHARAGNVLERTTLGQRGSVLMQLQVVAGGGRDFERRFSGGGGNSDIPRDFMKISVAECDIQE